MKKGQTVNKFNTSPSLVRCGRIARRQNFIFKHWSVMAFGQRAWYSVWFEILVSFLYQQPKYHMILLFRDWFRGETTFCRRNCKYESGISAKVIDFTDEFFLKTKKLNNGSGRKTVLFFFQIIPIDLSQFSQGMTFLFMTDFKIKVYVASKAWDSRRKETTNIHHLEQYTRQASKRPMLFVGHAHSMSQIFRGSLNGC